MNSSQFDYLAGLARYEFSIQGFRGGLAEDAQIRAAVGIIAQAIKAHAPGSFADYAAKAVTAVRTARLSNVPASQRTVATCNCGKPKAPHSPSLHS